MMEVDLEAVKKRLKTLEEQVKTISAPLPPPEIKIETETETMIKTEPETKIKIEPETERTRRVKATSSKIGERPVLPKQRGPPEKHQSAKPSASITLGESPGRMEQHEQAAKRKPRYPGLIEFCNWLLLVSKTPIQHLRDNGHTRPGQSTRTNKPVPSYDRDQTESMSVDNGEEYSGIDMDQLRAMMASDDQHVASQNQQS
jgi:hypothetical protein